MQAQITPAILPLRCALQSNAERHGEPVAHPRTCGGGSALRRTSSRRPYSCTDTKKGCAHSSYRNCSAARSRAVNAGGSSRWHQVAMTSVPPARG